MNKLICLILLTFCMTSCSYFAPRKRDIEQGNIFTNQQVQMLKIGMSESEVMQIMGRPITKNIFTPSVLVYVYSMQPGGKERTQKQVICTFKNGLLIQISA